MLIVVGLAGCASSYQVVQFPQREADLYPLSQTRDGISVAIDEVTRHHPLCIETGDWPLQETSSTR